VAVDNVLWATVDVGIFGSAEDVSVKLCPVIDGDTTVELSNGLWTITADDVIDCVPADVDTTFWTGLVLADADNAIWTGLVPAGLYIALPVKDATLSPSDGEVIAPISMLFSPVDRGLGLLSIKSIKSFICTVMKQTSIL
jgi:hypothetical protein